MAKPNITDKKLQGIDLYVAPERHRHGEKIEEVSCAVTSAQAGVIEQMRHKLKTAQGQAIYKMRKAIVEPVFGQIKEVKEFHGKDKVAAAWQVICLTDNLLELFTAKTCLQGA